MCGKLILSGRDAVSKSDRLLSLIASNVTEVYC